MVPKKRVERATVTLGVAITDIAATGCEENTLVQMLVLAFKDAHNVTKR
jgi:hypothetical protein